MNTHKTIKLIPHSNDKFYIEIVLVMSPPPVQACHDLLPHVWWLWSRYATPLSCFLLPPCVSIVSRLVDCGLVVHPKVSRCLGNTLEFRCRQSTFIFSWLWVSDLLILFTIFTFLRKHSTTDYIDGCMWVNDSGSFILLGARRVWILIHSSGLGTRDCIIMIYSCVPGAQSVLI